MADPKIAAVPFHDHHFQRNALLTGTIIQHTAGTGRRAGRSSGVEITCHQSINNTGGKGTAFCTALQCDSDHETGYTSFRKK